MISYLIGDRPDFGDLLDQLRGCSESPNWNRSLSDFGGMILLRATQEKVAKYMAQSVSKLRYRQGSNAEA